MNAYELLPRLTHLTLTAEDGRIGWIGTDEKWQQVEDEIDRYEAYDPFPPMKYRGSNYPPNLPEQ